MRAAKTFFKIFSISLVIIGLVASYVFLAPPDRAPRQGQSADAQTQFAGPTGDPRAEGPTSPPPGLED